MRVKWLGQGGYFFEFDKKQICIDPYLSNSVAVNDKDYERLQEVPINPSKLNVDMIICTHDHEIHLDEETISKTDYNDIIYAGPNSCYEHFKKLDIPQERLIRFNRNESIKIGDAEIIAVLAEHTEDSIGIIIRYEDLTIYVVGDSAYSERLIGAKDYEPDILICCINGKNGNMDYKEAARLAKDLEVNVIIPSNYGLFKNDNENPNKLKELMKNTEIEYNELIYDMFYTIG